MTGVQTCALPIYLKFTVVEPNGITLIDRLYEAVQDHCGVGNNATSYVAATYLMVIRFYGYKLDGVPTEVKRSQLIVEKFIPVIIKGIKFRVSNKLATYDFECKPVGQVVAGHTKRGTIPYDVELAEVTVGKLLGSTKAVAATSATQETAPDDGSYDRAEAARFARQGNAAAPQKATAAPNQKPSVKQGLMDAMNEYQEKLVKDGIYKKADR